MTLLRYVWVPQSRTILYENCLRSSKTITFNFHLISLLILYTVCLSVCPPACLPAIFSILTHTHTQTVYFVRLTYSARCIVRRLILTSHVRNFNNQFQVFANQTCHDKTLYTVNFSTFYCIIEPDFLFLFFVFFFCWAKIFHSITLFFPLSSFLFLFLCVWFTCAHFVECTFCIYI